MSILLRVWKFERLFHLSAPLISFFYIFTRLWTGEEDRSVWYEMLSQTAQYPLGWTQDKQLCSSRNRQMCWTTRPLLAIVKRRKLAWFGHVTRHNTLSKTILQGTVEGGRRKGRPRKSWTEDIKVWTQAEMPALLEKASDRHRWRRLSSTASSCPPHDPVSHETWGVVRWGYNLETVKRKSTVTCKQSMVQIVNHIAQYSTGFRHSVLRNRAPS